MSIWNVFVLWATPILGVVWGILIIIDAKKRRNPHRYYPRPNFTFLEEEKDAKEGEEKDDQKNPEEMPEGAQQKMKEMKISEEKAKMILEALKNQEIQYIQQNRKKATKRPPSNKPDW